MVVRVEVAKAVAMAEAVTVEVEMEVEMLVMAPMVVVAAQAVGCWAEVASGEEEVAVRAPETEVKVEAVVLPGLGDARAAASHSRIPKLVLAPPNGRRAPRFGRRGALFFGAP